MNRTAQRVGIHTSVPFLLTVGGGFVIGGWIPPFSPAESFTQIAAHYHGHLSVRIAAEMLLFGSAFFVAPCAVITAQMRRMEGRSAIYANVQVLNAAIGVVGIQIAALMWLAISFFDGIEPSTTATMAALGWIVLLGAGGPVVMQNFAIALSILSSKNPVYPRWLGYTNIYLGLGIMVGILIPFFHTGPFAFNGVFGFGLVATDFFVWFILMYIYTIKAIATDTAENTSPIASPQAAPA